MLYFMGALDKKFLLLRALAELNINSKFLNFSFAQGS